MHTINQCIMSPGLSIVKSSALTDSERAHRGGPTALGNRVLAVSPCPLESLGLC